MSSNIYDDFEQDNMENDDDMAALGSILSWDEDEERTRNEMTGGQSTTGSITNKQSSKMLPDLVQFNNMKDDIPELSFLQYTGNMQGSPPNGASNSQSNDNNSRNSNAQISSQQDYQQQQQPNNMNYGQQQSPNQQQQQQSVPIGTQQAQNANFQQQVASLQQMLQQQQQHLAQNAQSQRQQGQQQQQFQSPQQGQQQQHQASSQPAQQQQQQQQSTMSNQLAQFVAQQALSMLQQNQQAESQRIEQEKVHQEQARQQQQTQAMNTMVQLQQNLQRAMQQQQTQFQDQKDPQQQQAGASRVEALQMRQGQSVPQFNPNDPNAFLQQLQYAQIQQQFQAAQQQGNTGVQVPAPSQQAAGAAAPSQATALQQQQLQALATAMRSQQQFQQLPQAMIEQLKLQYAQVAGNKQIPAPSSSVPHQNDSKPSAAKKSKATSGSKKSTTDSHTKDSPDEPTSSSNVALSETHTKNGVVSASDTDNEASRRSALLKDDEDDDDEDDEVDTSHMTPEERAVANRERNKEHARNTRLRKKAYLEKLKATVDDLCKERNTLVAERASAAKLLVEMHNTRTEVLMSFFALRSTFEKRRHLWASILDESCFACIMPITPYRSFPASEMQVSKCQRTILGIDGIMGDTASLHVLLASLVDRSRVPLGKIEFRYTLVAEEAVVAGNQMMARWVMSTTNAMQCGAKMEIYKQGMLCCRFNSSHKIVGLELMFDVMAFMLQLKQAAGLETFSVVPNTVQTCQRTFDKPVVMTAAEPPYTIVQVNKLWEDMTGYTADQVVGKASCAILQGQRTDRKAVEDMMTEVRFKRAAFSSIINYKRTGAAFRNFIALYPLSTDSRIAHYLAITEFTDDGESPTSTGQQQQQHQRGGAQPMSNIPQISLPILSVFQQTPSVQQQALTHILSTTAPGSLTNQQAVSMLGGLSSSGGGGGGGSDSMSFSGSTGTKRSHDSGRD